MTEVLWGVSLAYFIAGNLTGYRDYQAIAALWAIGAVLSGKRT